MSRVVLQEFVSLDGYVAGPLDGVDFIPASLRGDRTFGREQLALINGVGTLLLGRVTYEMFVHYWPNVTEGEEKEFADRFNRAERVVFSRRLEQAPWGRWPASRIVRTDAAEEVAQRKKKPGKDLLVSGSISIAQTLMTKGLVDEYRLVLCPVVLGGGRPLFPAGAPSIPLALASAIQLDRGAVSLVYRPIGAAR